MLQIPERDHQAQGQAWTPGLGGAPATEGDGGAKEVNVFNLFACLGRSGKAVGKGAFDFLPGHATCQHRQRVAQVDHLVQTAAKEIIGAGGHGEPSETPRNSIWKG